MACEVLVQGITAHAGGDRHVLFFFNLMGWDRHVVEPDPRLLCLFCDACLFEQDFEDGFIGEFVYFLNLVGGEWVDPLDFIFYIFFGVPGDFIWAIEH